MISFTSASLACFSVLFLLKTNVVQLGGFGILNQASQSQRVVWWGTGLQLTWLKVMPDFKVSELWPILTVDWL